MGYFEICNIFVENFKKMEKIIGIGNALTDIMAVVEEDGLFDSINLPKGSTQFIEKERLPEILDLFSTMDTKRVPGGSSANTIRSLAHMGIPTGYIGKVGQDEIGSSYIQGMQSLHIDTHFSYSELPSGIASTFISKDGERSFIDYLGAAATLTDKDIAAENLKGYSYLYIEGYLVQDHEMITHAMQTAKNMGLKVCMDMSSYNIVSADLPFFKKLIHDYVDIVFANEQEAHAYAEGTVEEVIELLGKDCEIAIVKIGAEGSLIRRNGETVKVKALHVEDAIDSNGAGDYYAAGFMYGLLHGYSLSLCGWLGSLFSAHIIRVIGTALPDEQWEEIKREIGRIQLK
jgi:sugar/nucleoside kinase (ribokinase family)